MFVVLALVLEVEQGIQDSAVGRKGEQVHFLTEAKIFHIEGAEVLQLRIEVI